MSLNVIIVEKRVIKPENARIEVSITMKGEE